ncbi:MAG: hypothetical protein IRZ11_07310 [Clostridia bacterium]|nr:hypothetical protein [Clostridia bacterium]
MAAFAAAAFAVLASVSPAGAQASPQRSPGRLVVVLVPDLGWGDVAAPELAAFARGAAWADLNVRGAENTRASSYATLGAGAAASAERLDAGYGDLEASPEGLARDVFRRRTGEEAPKRSVLELDMPSVARANAGGRAEPGALGAALHAAGLATAVWGNADVPGEPERGAVLFLADRLGVVDVGLVGPATLAVDPDAPFGRAADLDGFYAFWRGLRPPADGGPSVVAVEFGDLWRQTRYAPLAEPGVAESQREAARRALAALLDRLMRSLDPARDGLLLVSPVAREDPRAPDYLTPLALWGRGAEPGLLRSPGTRRPGLVTALDLAPTVLAWFGLVPPATMEGRPISVVPMADEEALAGQATPTPSESEAPVGTSEPLPGQAVPGLGAPPAVLTAVHIHERTLNIDRLRPDLIRGWIAAYLVAVAFASARLVSARRRLGSLAHVLAYLAALGPGFLLATASPWPPWSGLLAGVVDVALAALLIAALSAWVGRRLWGRPEGTLYALAALTALLITVDAARGGFWTRWSYLGYSALSGARYYGIGNELMGVWVGAVLVLMVGILELAPRRGLPLVALAMASCVGLLAWPQGGANFGGATAAVLAMVPAFLAAWRGRIRVTDFAWAALGFLAVALGMTAADLALGGSVSHVGRLAEEVRAAGPGPLVRIALEKLALEWRLVALTIWTRLLAVTLASAAVLLLWAPEPMGRLWRGRPFLRAAGLGFGIAVPALILLNDSGVVAAATMLTVVAPAFFAGVGEELERG